MSAPSRVPGAGAYGPGFPTAAPGGPAVVSASATPSVPATEQSVVETSLRARVEQLERQLGSASDRETALVQKLFGKDQEIGDMSEQLIMAQGQLDQAKQELNMNVEAFLKSQRDRELGLLPSASVSVSASPAPAPAEDTSVLEAQFGALAAQQEALEAELTSTKAVLAQKTTELDAIARAFQAAERSAPASAIGAGAGAPRSTSLADKLNRLLQDHKELKEKFESLMRQHIAVKAQNSEQAAKITRLEAERKA